MFVTSIWERLQTIHTVFFVFLLCYRALRDCRRWRHRWRHRGAARTHETSVHVLTSVASHWITSYTVSADRSTATHLVCSSAPARAIKHFKYMMPIITISISIAFNCRRNWDGQKTGGFVLLSFQNCEECGMARNMAGRNPAFLGSLAMILVRPF